MIVTRGLGRSEQLLVTGGLGRTGVSALGGKVKVYIAGSWVAKQAKLYISGAWVAHPVRWSNGSSWTLTGD